MNFKDLVAIDIHSHFNHGERFDPPESEIYRCDLPFLKKGYDAANISLACFSTFSSVMSTQIIVEENDFLYNLSLDMPWVYQWVVIDPRIAETFKQARKMLLSSKCVGIKLDVPCHGYDIVEFADKLFAFAEEFETVIKMCPSKIPLLPAIADKYPHMKLILAHLGGPMHVDGVVNSKVGNIYTDTSGCASSNNNVLEYALTRIPSEKILFGTDTYAAGFQRGRIEYANISETDKINILRENALRIFPKLRKV